MVTLDLLTRLTSRPFARAALLTTSVFAVMVTPALAQHRARLAVGGHGESPARQ